MYLYVYIYVYVYMNMYILIHILIVECVTFVLKQQTDQAGAGSCRVALSQ